MIRVRAYPAIKADPVTGPEEARLNIDFTGVDLLKFQALLNRALNTAPEFGKDWFALSAGADKFIAANFISQ